MTRIPDFTKVAFADTPGPAPATTAPWLPPEGIAVKSAYTAGDIAGLTGLGGFPGIAP